MKIAFIGIKGLPAKDGASRVVENIITTLDKANYSITVYANRNYHKQKFIDSGYKQIIISTFRLQKNINVIFYFLNSALHALFFGNYDIIHLHNIDCAFIIPILKIKYRVICTSHGAEFSKLGKWGTFAKTYFKLMKIIFFRYSDYITSVSLPAAQYYGKKMNKKIYYIPNGINLDEDFDVLKADLCLKKFNITGEFILFSAGRIIPIKGLHLLLNAYRKIDIKEKCVIIGDINQVEEYRIKINKLILDTNSQYIGFIKEKSELLGIVSRAKLFIFPSLVENMSMMLLEVASIKTPIICSDIPENTSIFTNDEVLFFKTGNEQDLSEKLKWAIINIDNMKEKALKAYLKVRQNYLWSDITKQYEKLYKKVLNENHA
jgi:glycosyltransferase involved in cell wall biosynthesis